MVAGMSFQSFAQTNPGTANLKHQWTFDDETAKDDIGGADGTLTGAATISSKALNTSAGGHLVLPAATIGVNSYVAFSQEVWFTSSAGSNGGCTMLSYFGNTTGSFGTDYVFMSPASCNRCRAAISCGNTSAPWSAENGVNRTAGAIDDGKLHQMVTILDATSLTFYLDGVSLGSVTYTGSNAISAIGTQFAYLCKGGYYLMLFL